MTGAQQLFALAGDDWAIAVRHGLDDSDNYLLDLDHATESRVEGDHVEPRLIEFNRRIFQVFRWAITDDMHAEMDPTPRV